MSNQPESHEEEKSFESESRESKFDAVKSEAIPFDPNIVLNWQIGVENGSKRLEVSMPICQGAVNNAIETDLLTHGFPSLEGNQVDQFVVGENEVRREKSPPPYTAPGGSKPSGSVTPSAPISTSSHQPTVPDSVKATADSGSNDLGDAAKDIFDDPEQMIEKFIKNLQFTWQISGKHNQQTGEFEIQGYVSPAKDGENPVVITPSATADSSASSKQPGQIVVSLAKGEKVIQCDDESPVLTEIQSKPVATQAASGAGNIVNSNFTTNGDIKLNGLFNAIGFLIQAALGVQFNVIVNLGAGAGADTG